MENFLLGLHQLIEPMVFLALVGGTMLGLTVGALPGLNDSITIAVLIPVTFGMNPYIALAMLVGIYCSSACAGSIPAVLLEIPGTASAMATAWDGYQMTLKGRAKQALSICLTSSVFGGISSSLILLFFAPILARYALKFGPPEYFMLAIVGMSTVVGMAGKNVTKNFLSMALGLLLSCIGMSPTTGFARYTFGTATLMDGIPLIPRMIGLFGICSILKMCDSASKSKGIVNQVPTESCENDRIGLPDKAMCKRLLPTWLRSSALGNVLGIIPGAGMTMAIFLAYDQAKKAKPKLKFGTGVPEGIAAPEAANNAVVASSMVPLLSLGIPGNGTSALFLGALIIQGMRTGPSLFTDYPEMAYMIIVGFLIANVIMLPMSFAFCKYFASKVLKLNPNILASVVLVLCITGSFAYMNNLFHVGAMVVFGIIGYLFWKFGIPQAPLILTTILGSMMEQNWISSMVYENGSLKVFVNRPVSLILTIIAALFFVWPLIQKMITRKKHADSYELEN